MLRKVRIILATVFFIALTGLFLDFTGVLHVYLGWLAKIQFMPAVLALNVGVIVGLVLLTLLFGRIYCSVICPMGVFQDIVSWISGKRRGKKFRFGYSRAKSWLRYIVLALFIAAVIAGVGSFVALLDPYSAFGRMASNLLAPVWDWGNNLLAAISERAGGYGFYSKDVWIKSLPTFIVAAVTLVAVVVLAWRGGRTYCNTICPVGSFLGLISRFSLFRPTIDLEKCNTCGVCASKCKASCIDSKGHRIDYSRCVDCMDCIQACSHNAMKYSWRFRKGPGTAAKPASVPVNPNGTYARMTAGAGATGAGTTGAGNAGKGTVSVTAGTVTTGAETAGTPNPRRSFLTGAGLLIGGLVATKAQDKAAEAQEHFGDGGYADVADKIAPQRATRIVPPGAVGLRHLAKHCTGCQLCVTVCPSGVLRPSAGLMTLMQPESSYERGYCRPECTKCSEVCPTGAIERITTIDKTSIQIGHAVWVRENCIPLTDGVNCGNCARHCPAGAISMVLSEPGNPASRRVPAVNAERCIGCGACEYVCPARPYSAIYVEGHEVHRTI